MNVLSQIIDCRRILSWTYCFGYYQFMEEAEMQAKENAEQAAGALQVRSEEAEMQAKENVEQAAGALLVRSEEEDF